MEYCPGEKFDDGDPCPTEGCKGTLELDPGTMATYDDPGEGPTLYCPECGEDIDYDDTDWDSIAESANRFGARPTPEQAEEIMRLRSQINDATIDARGRMVPMTVEEFFSCLPDDGSDLEWEVGPEDVGNVYRCGERDCPVGVHVSFQAMTIGRKDGKRWVEILIGDTDGDFQPEDCYYDEREGMTPEDWDLGTDGQERMIEHFEGWARYALDCAESGEDPLYTIFRPIKRGEWVDLWISSAKNHLRYLMMTGGGGTNK